MGLFEKLFPKKQKQIAENQFFQLLTGYTPVFSDWDGAIYESELVRSAIDARARHVSKLRFEFIGSAKPKLRTRLQHAPNDYQTWSQFAYRMETILDTRNTCFILPVWDRYQEMITGIITITPQSYELVEANGEPWLRFRFENGQITAEPLATVGIMTRYQYKSDLFGENNTALDDTMKLIDIQKQGIQEAVKSSASYRFAAKMTNFVKTSDIIKERNEFNSQNFGGGNGGGLILFPSTYTDIQQVRSQPYTVDAEQMKQIQTNVFNYFGVNDAILQNTAKGDELDAFYNGAIEPIAIQLSEVLTRMFYTPAEQAHGSMVQVTANRLQYMTTSEKISMGKEFGDRGYIMIDEIRELLNYPPLPDGLGQRVPIRGEYYFLGEGKDADPEEPVSDDPVAEPAQPQAQEEDNANQE